MLKALDEKENRGSGQPPTFWQAVGSPAACGIPRQIRSAFPAGSLLIFALCRIAVAVGRGLSGVSITGQRGIPDVGNGFWAEFAGLPGQIEDICTPYTADTMELPKDSLFEAVRKYDVGVFGIKPFASNSLFKGDSSPDSPEAEEDSKQARLAIRYILANPTITAPIPGLVSIAQVDNVAKSIREGPGSTEAEAQELHLASQEMWQRLPPEYEWLKVQKYV